MNSYYWDSFKTHLNRHNPGSILTRQDLIKYFRKSGWPERRVDDYRLILTHAGYIKKMVHGCYQIVEHIPKNLRLKVQGWRPLKIN